MSNKLTHARHAANMAIIDILKNYLINYPDIRFSQALVNLGLVNMALDKPLNRWVDEYNLEPMELLQRVYDRADA